MADGLEAGLPASGRQAGGGQAGLLEAVLDSWDRNNAILVNLVRAVPEGGLAVRAMEGGPSVAEMFTHMHYARLVLVSEDAPEFATQVPEEEWAGERDPERIAQMLNESAKPVRDAVKGRVEGGRDMDLHYDHPILMLQHLIWHEGYHHGQIKLALKLAGRPISDDEAGPVTWDIWMRKK
ncbi:MAG TPA: DinB family protein [Candidatus Acidoferrum sp.]|nr:DinB family protein [Candidatus Acidoferrum sp.]